MSNEKKPPQSILKKPNDASNKTKKRVQFTFTEEQEKKMKTKSERPQPLEKKFKEYVQPRIEQAILNNKNAQKLKNSPYFQSIKENIIARTKDQFIKKAKHYENPTDYVLDLFAKNQVENYFELDMDKTVIQQEEHAQAKINQIQKHLEKYNSHLMKATQKGKLEANHEKISTLNDLSNILLKADKQPTQRLEDFKSEFEAAKDILGKHRSPKTVQFFKNVSKVLLLGKMAKLITRNRSFMEKSHGAKTSESIEKTIDNDEPNGPGSLGPR